MWRFPAILLWAILLAGCGRSGPVTVPDESRAPAALPRDARVYRIDSAASALRVLVYRDGALAALGHNHVISSRALSGLVWLGANPAEAVMRLSLPADSLEVDRPELRAAAGDDFPGELDQSAIEGTRDNMLGERVLNAVMYPEISLSSAYITGRLPDLQLAVDIEVAGRRARIELPANVRLEGDKLQASGEFSLLQSTLGMEPFSVMLGVLAVRDELFIRYRITARRDTG